MYATDSQDALVPIFARQKYSDKLEQVGTGIFIEFLSQPFLFTAAHVTDELEQTELMVPVHDSIESIEGYVAHIDLLPGTSRSDDYVDIAYYRLSTRFAQLMCAYFKPLPQSRSLLVSSALELGVCSVYGYPTSKSKLRQGVYSSGAATFRGVAAQAKVYEGLGLSAEHNILVHFHKKRAVSPKDGSRINPTSPKGVSGGGIFACPDGHELSNDWSLPKLVGIFHSYKKAEGLMVGTQLLPVFAAIQLGEMKGYDGVV